MTTPGPLAPSPADRFVAIGLSLRSGAVSQLEQAALSDRMRQLRVRLADMAAGSELDVVVLATCQRLEVYATAAEPGPATDAIVSALVEATSAEPAEAYSHLYVHRGETALAHLVTVAAGLDSATVGEPQVLTQLRQSLKEALAAGTVGPDLQRVIQKAIRAGRTIRTRAAFAPSGPSLADAAWNEATQVLGPIQDRPILVIGAGSMARATLVAIRRHRVGAVTVASRDPASGRHLAERTAASWIDVDQASQLLAALESAALVISCTSADHHIVSRALVSASRRHSPHTTQVLVDLALPRDIDPAVGDLPGVHLFGLQDLSNGVPVDELAVSRAQRLVTAEVEVQVTAMRAGVAAGQIIRLRALAHRIADTEIARLRTHAGSGDPDTLAEAEQAIRRTVNKLLHAPTVRLKELAVIGDVDGLHALGGVFDLPAKLPPMAASGALTAREIS